MSRIISYDFERIRSFMHSEEQAYKDQITQTLVFEDWKCRAFPTLASNPSKFGVTPYEWGSRIRIAPTGEQMARILKDNIRAIQDIEFNCPIERQDFEKTKLLKELFKPVNEFVIPAPITIPGKTTDGVETEVPIWFNTTVKEVTLRPGFANLDSANPAVFPLSDVMVHAMAGGRTGAGKSVLINDLIATLLLEYPPWELDLMLADFKIVELSRYGNRFPTPHVSVIAATGSTEFALSVFQRMVAEMNARQEVFTAAGVTNLKDFRKKFNLVMPRTVLIADEFVQMYENIKIAEAAGNDKADEMKRTINQAISAVARLGRSMGMHMLLSSQNMDGQLDEQTAGQFAGGITLGATPSVSNSLIGNTAGAYIEGKGKAYMNLNKAAKSVRDNVMVWVPFIQDAVSEEDAAKGKLSYLQDVLKTCCDLATRYGWDRKPFVFNENEPVSYNEFQRQLAYAGEAFSNPAKGSEIKNEIYKEVTAACLPLGRLVAYKENPVALLDLERRPYNNLVVGATVDVTKLYILKLLAEGFNQYQFKHFVIGADTVATRQLQLDKVLKDVTVSNRAVLPTRYFGMVKTRLSLIKFQEYLLDEGLKKCWDDEKAFTYHLNKMGEKALIGANVTAIKQFASAIRYNLVSLTQTSAIRDSASSQGIELTEADIKILASLVTELSAVKKTILSITKDENVVLTAAMFSQIVIWWIGAELVEGVSAYENKPTIKEFMSQCCQVGIFNVITAEKWASLAPLTECCNYVLEKCSKDFFMDLGLPKNININNNSFQIHNRSERTNCIVRTFSI